MPQPTRPAWDNGRHWPTCHKSQADAGLPEGPIVEDEPASGWQRLCFGLLFGLLLTGPALTDWLASW